MKIISNFSLLLHPYYLSDSTDTMLRTELDNDITVSATPPSDLIASHYRHAVKTSLQAISSRQVWFLPPSTLIMAWGLGP